MYTTCGISCSAIFYVTGKDKILDSNTYRWRSCKGKEAVRGEVRVVGVEDEADNADEPLPDVVVAVSQTLREVEKVTHPHGDLKYCIPIVAEEEGEGECRNVRRTSAAILVDNRCRGSDSRVVM